MRFVLDRTSGKVVPKEEPLDEMFVVVVPSEQCSAWNEKLERLRREVATAVCSCGQH